MVENLEVENPGKRIFEKRNQNFCYIQVIVFDLGYLPVAAVRTQQVRCHRQIAKVKNYNLNVSEVNRSSGFVFQKYFHPRISPLNFDDLSVEPRLWIFLIVNRSSNFGHIYQSYLYILYILSHQQHKILIQKNDMVSGEIWTPSIQDGSIYHFVFRLILGSESVLTLELEVLTRIPTVKLEIPGKSIISKNINRYHWKIALGQKL